jgi:hypothetical protein
MTDNPDSESFQSSSAGITKGKTMATHWAVYDQLAQFGAHYTRKPSALRPSSVRSVLKLNSN